MIAKTIMEQIGGRRFAAMTGSKDFIDLLSFSEHDGGQRK